MKEKNYGIFNINFFDNIIKNKRSEMLNILSKNINNKNLMSFLDIGTTEDNELESSNFFLKKFKQISIKKSISGCLSANETTLDKPNPSAQPYLFQHPKLIKLVII